MAYWRWIVALGIMLMMLTASVVHAATKNDTYIAGYERVC